MPYTGVFNKSLFLLSEFLFHLLLKEEGIDEFRDDDFIFFGEFDDAVELIDECFILYVLGGHVSGGSIH